MFIHNTLYMMHYTLYIACSYKSHLKVYGMAGLFKDCKELGVVSGLDMVPDHLHLTLLPRLGDGHSVDTSNFLQQSP